jgi:hypothetical protein
VCMVSYVPSNLSLFMIVFLAWFTYKQRPTRKYKGPGKTGPIPNNQQQRFFNFISKVLTKKLIVANRPFMDQKRWLLYSQKPLMKTDKSSPYSQILLLYESKWYLQFRLTHLIHLDFIAIITYFEQYKYPDSYYVYHDDDIHGVRLRLWTAATNGPQLIDVWAWRTMMSTEENSCLVHQSFLAVISAETSGRKQEEWAKWMII